MGKTEFLVEDFMPAARAGGYSCAYVNLWELKSDPATALVLALHQAIEPKSFAKVWERLNTPISKIKASGKFAGMAEAGVEAELGNRHQVAGTLLMQAMAEFDKYKKSLVLIIDEAQVLAAAENSVFAHALRAALDIRKDRLKVLFAGSSETTLRRMFGRASEPFYNWAALEPFPLLGVEFVAFMVWGPPADTQMSKAESRDVRFHTFIRCTSGPRVGRYVQSNLDCDGTSSEIEIAVENNIITEIKFLN